MNGHVEEVNTLISEAQQMVSTGDEILYDIPSSYTGNKDDVFVASLMRRGDNGLGLGLIDGMVCNPIFYLLFEVSYFICAKLTEISLKTPEKSRK